MRQMDQVFDRNELLLPLLEMSDLDTLKKLYRVYGKKLDDPYLLESLSLSKKVPFFKISWEKGSPDFVRIINSFFDLIFSLQIRDPILRENLCISSSKLIQIAAEEDVELFKYGLSKSDPSYETFITIGMTGNRQLIDLVMAVDTYYSGYDPSMDDVWCGQRSS